MTSQPPARVLDADTGPSLEPTSLDPTSLDPGLLGWPEALRVVDDPDGVAGQSRQRLEAGILDLLASAYAVLDGVTVAVRLRIPDVVDAVAAADGDTDQRDTLLGWPAGSPAVELLRLEELGDGGPALAAELVAATVDCGDLASTQLWPVITAAARRAGLCSALAVPVLDHSRVIGSLVVYVSGPRRQSVPVMTARLVALASHISVLLANAALIATTNRTIAQLREAMVSRSVIEQAKGVLMAREKVDADTAWEYLVRISQRRHRKLRDVCGDIVLRASSGSY